MIFYKNQALPWIVDALKTHPLRMPYSERHRVPAHLLPPHKFLSWREGVISRVKSLAGELAGISSRGEDFDLKVSKINEISANDSLGDYKYALHDCSIATEPGNRVPFYMLVPGTGCLQSGRNSCEAVIACHPHSNKMGRDLIALETSHPNQRTGPELVRLGFLVLVPAYPCLNGYSPDLKRLGYKSPLMKAMWDNIRLTEFIKTHENYRQGSKIGVMGHSLGGFNAIFTGLFNEHIGCVVSHAGFKCLAHHDIGNVDLMKETLLPCLRDLKAGEAIPFDFSEIIAALAPTPCAIMAPMYDDRMPHVSIEMAYQMGIAGYRLFDKGDNLVLFNPDSGHIFSPDARNHAYRFLLQHLRPMD